jgi:hypothetical protein
VPDHIIVWNETSLRRTLRSYFHYYEKSHTHLALAKDALQPRAPPIDRRTFVLLPFLRWAACTIDTNGALLSRSFATPYLVRSMLSSQLRLLLSFATPELNWHIHGWAFHAMNRSSEFHLRLLSVPADTRKAG